MIQLHDLLHVEEIKASAITGIIHGLILSHEGITFEVLVSVSDQAKLSTRNSDATPVVETAPQVASAVLEVHCNDAIELRAKNPNAEAQLHNYGKWWKVQGGYRDGSQWLLNSIAKQPRKAGSKVYHSIIAHKITDPNYEIVRVCTFPREFIYKEWAR